MEYLMVVASLILVIGLIMLLAWAMRRFQNLPGGLGRANARSIEVREVRPLDSRNRLVVAHWQGSTYLLGASDQGITLIDKHMGDASAAETSDVRSGFKNALQQDKKDTAPASSKRNQDMLP